MRRVYATLTGICLILFCTTCKPFTADIDEYLSRWAAEVIATDYRINPSYSTNAAGALCVPSIADDGTDTDVTVTVNLHNPKNFRLVMPAASPADAGKVIRFPGLSPQPTYGTDYTLTQSADDTLTLTYKSSFLKKYEWGTGDISPEISLIAADNDRVFGQKFHLNLRADTSPALDYKGIGKTQVGSEWYYVLIFQAKGMNAKIGTEYVHKDIKKLHITKEGGVSAVYTIQNINFSSQTFSWSPGDPLLDTATQLGSGDYEGAAPDFPASTDKWLIYYKTDIEISPSSAAKIYTAQLSDAAGLRSNEVECSTVKRKVGLIDLVVTNPSPYIPQSGENGDHDHPYRVRCDENGATLKATCNTPGVTISYTVYDIISGTAVETSKNSGASPLTGIRLIAPGTVGNIKTYKVVLKATAPGFTEYTPDVYYTLTRAGGVTIDASVQHPQQVWKKLREAVANAAADDIITIKGEIKATNVGTLSNANWGKITIDKNLTIRGKNGKDTDILNANTDGTGKIHRIFEVQNGATLILSGLTLKGGTAPVGANGGGIFVAGGSKVELSNCMIEGCKAGTGGNGGAIGSLGTVTITGSTLTGNSATNGGAVYVNGSGTKFTMHSGAISGNTVQSAGQKTSGGGVYVNAGATFTMGGGTISGNTATTKGTSVGSKAMGGGVCVSGSGSKFIMEGNSPSISDNEVKTAGSGTDLLTIGGGVCVCDGAIFEMKAGSIKNNKALKGDKQYFGHTGGGVCVGDSVDGGTSGATFTMKGGTISDNEAGYGGGVAVTSNSSFKMSGDDSKISGNKASYEDPSHKKQGSGGGVFVLYGTLDMTGGVINGNEAGYGGGIHGKAHGSSNKGEIIVSGNSTISNNIADSGGGITSEYKLSIKEHDSKTPTIKENNANSICGGIYLRYDNILSFTGGTVIGNTASSGLGKGMYLETNRTKVKMSGSATVDKNNDVHLGGLNSANYAYITVTGALTAQHAATLTMRSDSGYTEGREVVKGDGFPLTLDYINKFPITKQTAPEQSWTTELDTNALKLKKTTP